MVYVDEEARKKRTFAGRKPIPESTKDEIITDYNAGMSAKKIAEKYMISTKSLYRIVKQRTRVAYEENSGRCQEPDQD